jgi:hypothetical protein
VRRSVCPRHEGPVHARQRDSQGTLGEAPSGPRLSVKARARQRLSRRAEVL